MKKQDLAYSQKGFTLTELIITIMVMGVIAAIITQGMGQYLKRGKDQERKSELSQIQQALTLYYNDFQSYPCADGAYFVGSLPGCGLGVGYIKEIPHDGMAPPNNCSAQFSDYAYVVLNSQQDYKLYANLENQNDPATTGPYDISIGATNCDYNYLITNP